MEVKIGQGTAWSLRGCYPGLRGGGCPFVHSLYSPNSHLCFL